VEFGAHLPQIGWDAARPFTLELLERYVTTARALGFTAISANDHIVWQGSWLDAPTMLAASLPFADGLTLATTIGLPVIRGPAVYAKTMATLDHLSGGRVIAGVAPGSSADDYALVGVPHAERWKRFDESIAVLRAMWQPGAPAFRGDFYSTEGKWCEPQPARAGGPPVWIGSWGSERGMRRVASLGDGWLASAYNTTPERFANGLATLNGLLVDADRDHSTFENALATGWMHVGEDADAVLSGMAATLKRPVDDLREQLPIGSPSHVAEIVTRYRDVGLQRMFVWPVGDDPVEQLQRFADAVL
jgi:alkanesulfonate monooxygenase SsuD/methylene tetrahydromethanopterin reductase-like flavin-dependent oxidoreductase (luciferase family)